MNNKNLLMIISIFVILALLALVIYLSTKNCKESLSLPEDSEMRKEGKAYEKWYEDLYLCDAIVNVASGLSSLPRPGDAPLNISRMEKYRRENRRETIQKLVKLLNDRKCVTNLYSDNRLFTKINRGISAPPDTPLYEKENRMHELRNGFYENTVFKINSENNNVLHF